MAAHVCIQGPPANIIASDFNITKHDMATVYMSPDPFFEFFEKNLDLRKWSYEKHRTTGLSLVFHNSHLYLGGMTPGSPCAKVDQWRVNLHGAWLIKVGPSEVSSISDAQVAFRALYDSGTPSATLLFLHPELRCDISNKGLPIVLLAPFSLQTQDQLHRRWDFTSVAEYLHKAAPYKVVDSGNVLNYVTRVMKLTRGKLLHQDD